MPQVLIVDDDEAVRRLLELLLKTSGYDTVTATNGVEGLEQMHRQLPCVVLLDVNMPSDGWIRFRRQQLADPRLAAVPVLCLTGHYEPEQITMQLGVACLSKPPHFPTFLGCGRGQMWSGESVDGGRDATRTVGHRETDRLTTAGATSGTILTE